MPRERAELHVITWVPDQNIRFLSRLSELSDATMYQIRTFSYAGAGILYWHIGILTFLHFDIVMKFFYGTRRLFITSFTCTGNMVRRDVFRSSSLSSKMNSQMTDDRRTDFKKFWWRLVKERDSDRFFRATLQDWPLISLIIAMTSFSHWLHLELWCKLVQFPRVPAEEDGSSEIWPRPDDTRHTRLITEQWPSRPRQ
jgi:hypothetical protein